MTLQAMPTTLKDAQGFVGKFHRHHKSPVGHRWSVGCAKRGELVGVAVVGRPVAHKTPQYSVAEVTRLCTDGTKNACSFLYALAARIACEMGFKRIQTFILDTEPGTSLQAAGWRYDGSTAGGNWNRPSRGNRRTDQPMQAKQRWVKDFV